MNEQRLKGLMGLCVRAGQGIFGEDSCLKALRNGQAGLLILDGEISEAAEEKYRQLCRREGVRAAKLREGLLWEATGKPGKAMAVRKGSFAQQMAEILEEKAAE